MKIPWSALSPEALRGLIEEFVSRDGTDYGAIEVSLAQKVAQIERQLQAGDIEIVFVSASGSTTIMPVGTGS